MFFTFLLCSLLVCTLAHCQNGYYMSQAGGLVSGKYTVSLTGAHNWAVGFTTTFRMNLKLTPLKCNDLLFTFYRGTEFISVSVVNQYACHCSCMWVGAKCCMATAQGGTATGWQKRHIPPFSVQFVDASSTASYVLPTRENTPKNMPLESYTFTAPNALDARLATPLMNVVVNFMPRQTNLLAWSGKLMCSTPNCNDHATYSEMMSMSESNAENSLGWWFEVRKCHQSGGHYGTYHAELRTRRKPPMPSWIWKTRKGNYHSNQPFATNFITYTRIYLGDNSNIKSISYSNGGHSEMYWYDACSTNSLVIAEFYENKRFQSATERVSLSALSAALSPAPPGSVEFVVLNGTQPITVRVTRTGLIKDSEACGSCLESQANQTLALHFTQPYPIQDVWCLIYDTSANRLFTAVERQVPYRMGTGTQNLGWLFALDGVLHGSDEVDITIRFNRRAELGVSPEEERALLLHQFAADKGGNLTNVIVPIPKTIVATPGTMGGIVIGPVSSGDTVFDVPWVACLHANHTADWYKKTLKTTMAGDDSWKGVLNNTDSAHEEDYVKMTVFLSTWATSTLDWSTNAWVLTDSFYPEVPEMLPHFWDAQTANRLYGHTQVMTFIQYEISKWAGEHAALSAKWPWFGAEVSVERYQRIRAQCRRSAIIFDGRPMLVPIINLLRHSYSGPPNANIVVNKHTERVEIIAASNLAAQEEILPDFDASGYTKHEFLMYFGYVPPAAIDVATVANYHGYLYNTDASRQKIAQEWQAAYGETYKQALARLLTAMSLALANLPLAIDGLGSTTDRVNQASMILAAERSVLMAQIAAGNSEYASL